MINQSWHNGPKECLHLLIQAVNAVDAALFVAQHGWQPPPVHLPPLEVSAIPMEDEMTQCEASHWLVSASNVPHVHSAVTSHAIAHHMSTCLLLCVNL